MAVAACDGGVASLASSWASLASLVGEVATLETSVSATYELGAPLGRGSFSTVYAGRVRATGEHVAIKIVDPAHFVVDPAGTLRLFHHEASVLRAATALGSPNLVRFVAAHVDMTQQQQQRSGGPSAAAAAPVLAIVMQLCRERDLLDSVASRCRGRGAEAVVFEESEAAAITQKLGRALLALHSRGILHRCVDVVCV